MANQPISMQRIKQIKRYHHEGKAIPINTNATKVYKIADVLDLVMTSKRNDYPVILCL
jgi:hypothetical protein